MTPLTLWLQSKKTEWLKHHEDAWFQEFSSKRDELEEKKNSLDQSFRNEVVLKQKSHDESLRLLQDSFSKRYKELQDNVTVQEETYQKDYAIKKKEIESSLDILRLDSKKEKERFQREHDLQKKEFEDSIQTLHENFRKRSKDIQDRIDQQEEFYTRQTDSRKNDFDGSIQILQQDLQRKGADLNERIKQMEIKSEELTRIEKLVEDRRVELDSMRQDYKEQIRVLEAKASPSQVWETAFSSGFSKAWDMMTPFMTGGLEEAKKRIHDQAVDETIKGLDKVITERAKKLNGNKVYTD